jgi:membrane protein YqaA with SNARE-associated domain
MNLLIYILVFLASLFVDIVPFIGPPAWMVMVFFQIKFGLNIWIVLIFGVVGSAIGRYLYSVYIRLLANRFIKSQKNDDLRFIGGKLADKNWKVQFFVLFYTLMPLPSTPLFTAAGVSGIKSLYLIPAFFIGKFISDGIMVFTGDYVAINIDSITHGLLSWNVLVGTVVGLLLICFFLFIDWRKLLQEKKIVINFNIWK